MNAIKTWWHNHVQTTLGALVFALAGADMSPYAAPMKLVFGKYGDYVYAALFLVSGCAIFIRAVQAKKAKANVLPPPVNAAKVLMIALVLATTFSTCIAVAVEVPVEQDAPKVEWHPLTSVVVTQCNLIVAVYMTMPDGRLLRFDKSAAVPSEQLMTMAYSAVRSERVEVSCNQVGAAGYERHEPV
ncbi:MAG: hypothetical protein JWN43_3076 [Gammaproteobacteria bacterium]|nr:hypothetical protein [Gammaproteobacteria bacterium]